VIADGNDIAVVKMVFGDALVVHEGAVRAVQVLDEGILTDGENAGVIAADRHVVEQNFTARTAADVHVALFENDLVDDDVVEFKNHLGHGFYLTTGIEENGFSYINIGSHTTGLPSVFLGA
jgi:hypothetical protein